MSISQILPHTHTLYANDPPESQEEMKGDNNPCKSLPPVMPRSAWPLELEMRLFPLSAGEKERECMRACVACVCERVCVCLCACTRERQSEILRVCMQGCVKQMNVSLGGKPCRGRQRGEEAV